MWYAFIRPPELGLVNKGMNKWKGQTSFLPMMQE